MWKEIYDQAFPGYEAMVDHRQDGEHQRAGIDRSIIMPNSKQILIDEKVRRKAYNDILLEHLSDKDRGIPGWVCKPLRADYIAYAIAPLGVVYLLPVIQLQQAWKKCGEYWIQKYRAIEAKNKSWVTISVGVPMPVLYKEIAGCWRYKFTPV